MNSANTPVAEGNWRLNFGGFVALEQPKTVSKLRVFQNLQFFSSTYSRCLLRLHLNQEYLTTNTG